jgi:hypothetical protein
MSKRLLIVLAIVLTLGVASVASAQLKCNEYTIGFKGKVLFCYLMQDIPAVGAMATLSTPEGDSVSVPVQWDGSYDIRLTLSNVPNLPPYAYNQKFEVAIDLTPSLLGNETYKCITSTNFLCYCAFCFQEFIATCDTRFRGALCTH